MSEFIEKINSVGAMTPFLWMVIFFHMLLLFNQIVYFISKPGDKVRLRFAFLIVLYIIYNLTTGFLPDERIGINYTLQIQIAYCYPILMVYYLAYYIYKLLEIKSFYRLLVVVPIFTLILPYIVFFLIPYLVTHNEMASSQLFTIIPGAYAIYLLIKINLAVKKNYHIQKNKVTHFKLKVISINLVVISHLGLAASQFSDNQAVELMLVNSGFIVVAIIFLVVLVIDSQSDYTRLISSEAKLSRYSQDLENVNRQQANTFVSLAHETRTPITLIKNNLETYSKTNKPNQEIENVKKYVEKLSSHINNILDIEQSLSGKSIYNHDSIVNLSEYTEMLVQSFQPYCHKKNIQLSYKIEDGVYLKIASNAMESLVNNLVENAIKYTSFGGEIKAVLSTNELKIKLSVSDTGCGISEEHMDKIFEPYFRINNSENTIEGVGIGLSIVKNIVSDLDGEIVVESKDNEGSTFSVFLEKYVGDIPAEKAVLISEIKGAKEMPSPIPDVITDKDLPNVLIVEDNNDLLKYLQDNLKESYNIFVAMNGVLAWQKIEQIENKPDIILSDIMMEEMDGKRFLKKLLDSEFSYIPVVFITAKANKQDRNRMLDLGAVDYIYKPFDIEEVKTKVKSIIVNTRKQRSQALNSIQNLLNNHKDKLVEVKNIKADVFQSNCMYYNISPREKEIIGLAKKGKIYREIASELFISTKTVDNHFQRIYKKVEVSNKQELLDKLLFVKENSI